MPVITTFKLLQPQITKTFCFSINFRYEIFNRKTPMIFQNLMKMDYQEFCIRGNKYLA